MNIFSILKEEQFEYKNLLSEEKEDNTGASIVNMPGGTPAQKSLKPTALPREQKKVKLKYIPQGSMERTLQLITALRQAEEMQAAQQAQMQQPVQENFNIKRTINNLRSFALGGALGIAGAGGYHMTKQSPQPVQQQTQQVVQQQATPQQQAAPQKQEKAPFQWSTPHMGWFLGAVASQEHKAGAKVPHTQYDPRFAIRTKVPGEGSKKSSAFGRFQITGSTVEDHLKRYPEHFKGLEDYAGKFVKQSKKFLTAKDNDPVYGLGGAGDLSGEEHHEDYLRLTDAIARGKLRDRKIDPNNPNMDMNKAIHSWRGVPEDKDPSYYRGARAWYDAARKEALKNAKKSQ